MPVPKQRHTKSRRNRRRSHHALRLSPLVQCSHCRRLTMPHRVCSFCGYYAGREVLDVLAKLSRRERKAREKEEKERQKERRREEKAASGT